MFHWNVHCLLHLSRSLTFVFDFQAVLTNLSAVNPTKLNGAGFEQPVPLKHGDVLTIIDRSFRCVPGPHSLFI